MKMTQGTVTDANGFTAAGYAAGIKYQGRKDMAMICSSAPCHAAGVFTSNVVKAAPVLWDKKIVTESDAVYAVVVNSGIANACTGKDGYEICEKTAEAVGKELSVPADGVLIGSTGVIGMQIPIDKVTDGVKHLKNLLFLRSVSPYIFPLYPADIHFRYRQNCPRCSYLYSLLSALRLFAMHHIQSQ